MNTCFQATFTEHCNTPGFTSNIVYFNLKLSMPKIIICSRQLIDSLSCI